MKTPIYMLTVEYSNPNRQPLNVALGPNQQTLYEMGDRDYGKKPGVSRITVKRVFPLPHRKGGYKGKSREQA